jgi:nucleotide-binding universal stress UspA family protein
MPPWSVMADAALETAASAREQIAEDWLELRAVGGTSPARGLHDFLEREQADLVVVGSAHRGRIRQLLVSSTGERLLNGAPCPVAVAPKGFAAAAAPPREIAAAYDASSDAGAALHDAAALAQELGAGLKVIGVLAPLDVFTAEALYAQHQSDEEISAHRRELLARIVQEAIEPLPSDLRVTTALVEGHAADQILAEAHKGIDVLVMGSRSYGPVRRVLLGSTSIDVMRHAPCPVIVVPRGAVSPSADVELAAATGA